MENKEEIMGSVTKGKRLGGAGRKTILGADVEDILIGLINAERAEGNRVTGSQLKQWAKEAANDNDVVGNFKASQGWVRSFMERNGFSFRRVTNLTVLSSDELVKRAKSYME